MQTAPHCKLHHTANCTTLQTASHCNVPGRLGRGDFKAPDSEPSSPSLLRLLPGIRPWCVAVCCSVSQCVAVCCSVLQCVAVCCRVLQCVAMRYSVALHCSALQRVAVCCSVSQRQSPPLHLSYACPPASGPGKNSQKVSSLLNRLSTMTVKKTFGKNALGHQTSIRGPVQNSRKVCFVMILRRNSVAS